MINKTEPEWVYKYNTPEEITKETSKLRKKFDELSTKISLLDKRLREVCKHNLTETKTEYVEGSYYNKSEYITKQLCRVCGKELSRKVELGNYA